MVEKILGRASSLLILFVVLLPLFNYPGRSILLGSFFICAFLLSVFYLKETAVSIYTLLIFLYAISFLAQAVGFFANNGFHLPILHFFANTVFALLLLWTSRYLYNKIGGGAFYVSLTALILMLHVAVLLLANDKWLALSSNLYYVLLGLIATIKIKKEIDQALIPAEQKILNLILLVIAYPISNLVISTIQNF